MKRIIFISAIMLIFIMAFSKCARLEGNIQSPTEEATENGNGMDFDSFNINVKQVENSPSISIEWDAHSGLASVWVTVYHGDSQISMANLEGEGISAGNIELDAYYGRHLVNITLTDKYGRKLETSEEIDVIADEYIIAPISGSMPQLYFTLYMKEITQNHKIPAFVWLTRPDSWDWERLPENIFPMPTVDISEVLTHNNYDRMVEITDAYIKELYSISPNAKFHLYLNDYNVYLYLKLMVANDIPEKCYDVVLLSDGGASYAEFQNAFNSSAENFDANAKYATMAENLKILSNEVKAAGDYSPTGKFTVNTTEIRSYCYVIAKEMPNAEWWMLRPRADTLICPDKEFINNILENEVSRESDSADTPNHSRIIVEKSLSAPLEKMNDVERAALKDFYRFNDEMFAESQKEGKRAMVFLGSWANEVNEPDFDAYVRFMKLYFGNEFVYYYKGHPSTPTVNYLHKQQQIEELDLIDIESSINAELILFFYPDIYMCGYNSSTFMSAMSDEMAAAIFNMTRDECKNDYAERIGIFVSRIDNDNYKSYPECNYTSHSYFLVEFNKAESQYKYAIYDSDDDVIINGPKK